MKTTIYSNNNFGAYAKKACANYRLYWLAQQQKQNFEYIEDHLGDYEKLSSEDEYNLGDSMPFDLTATEMAVVTIYADGYNLREVADILGRNYSYVRSLFSSAKRKLLVRKCVTGEVQATNYKIFHDCGKAERGLVSRTSL